MTEAWRWVVGYEGKYEVSDMGNVRSWARGNAKAAPDKPKPMSASRNHGGYHVLSLCSNGKSTQYRVHCLVLQAFVGPRPDDFHGAHLDDDKNNNRLENLAWKSLGDNMRDRNINGRTACGVRSGRYTHGRFVGVSRKYYPPKYVGDIK